MSSRLPSVDDSSSSAESTSTSSSLDLFENINLLSNQIKNDVVNNNMIILQVEKSFIDHLNNKQKQVGNLFHQLKLSQHFVVNHTKQQQQHQQQNTMMNLLLDDLSSSSSSSSQRNSSSSTNNNSSLVSFSSLSIKQQQITLSETKSFIDQLRTQSALLWNLIEEKENNNDHNENNKDQHHLLFIARARCLAVELMIASLPAPSSIWKDSTILTAPNILECCWMMLKTSEKVLALLSKMKDHDEQQDSSVNHHLLFQKSCSYLSSIWKLVSCGGKNNSATLNSLHSKLSSIAKERLFSIGVDAASLLFEFNLFQITALKDSNINSVSHADDENVLHHHHEQVFEFLSSSSSSSSSNVNDKQFHHQPAIASNFVQKAVGSCLHYFLQSSSDHDLHHHHQKQRPSNNNNNNNNNKNTLSKIQVINSLLTLVSKIHQNNNNNDNFHNNLHSIRLTVIRARFERQNGGDDLDSALQTCQEVFNMIDNFQKQHSSSSSSYLMKRLHFATCLLQSRIYLEKESKEHDDDNDSKTDQELIFKAFQSLEILFKASLTSSQTCSDEFILAGVEQLANRDFEQIILKDKNEKSFHKGLGLVIQIIKNNNNEEKSSSKSFINSCSDFLIMNLGKILKMFAVEKKLVEGKDFSLPFLSEMVSSLMKVHSTSRNEKEKSNEDAAEELLSTLDEEEQEHNRQQHDEVHTIERDSHHYSLLWSRAQSLLTFIDDENNNNNNSHLELLSLSIQLLEFCSQLASSSCDVKQKCITLRALARAKILHASSLMTSSSSFGLDENISKMFDEAQCHLDEATSFSSSNSLSSSSSLPHSGLLQFQLHLYRHQFQPVSNISEILLKDLELIVGGPDRTKSMKMNNKNYFSNNIDDMKEALRIAAHLSKQLLSQDTSSTNDSKNSNNINNNEQMSLVCEGALRHLIDVEIASSSSSVSHQEEIFAMMHAWLDVLVDDENNNNKWIWCCDVIKQLSNDQNNIDDDDEFNKKSMRILQDFRFWVSKLLYVVQQQKQTLTSSSLSFRQRICCSCVSVVDKILEGMSSIMLKVISENKKNNQKHHLHHHHQEPINADNDESVSLLDQDAAAFTSSSKPSSQQQQQKIVPTGNDNTTNSSCSDSNDEDSPPRQISEGAGKQEGEVMKSDDEFHSLIDLQNDFHQLLRACATEFLLVSSYEYFQKNPSLLSVSIPEALCLVQTVKKSLLLSPSLDSHNNNIWLHLLTTEITFVLDLHKKSNKKNCSNDNDDDNENSINDEEKIQSLLNELKSKTSSSSSTTCEMKFILDKNTVLLQLAKRLAQLNQLFSCAQFCIDQILFSEEDDDDEENHQQQYNNIESFALFLSAAFVALDSCCPDKETQLRYAEKISNKMMKLFSEERQTFFLVKMTDDYEEPSHIKNINEDHAVTDGTFHNTSKNENNEEKNSFSWVTPQNRETLFYFCLQTMRAIICELWNATVFDVNVQNIERGTKFVVCLKKMGICLKKLQKKISSSSRSSNYEKEEHQQTEDSSISSLMKTNSMNNGFVEVLLAQFQAATQTTIPEVSQF